MATQSEKDRALEQVLGELHEEVRSEGGWRFVTRVHQLAVMWPQLAAALANLAEAHDVPSPSAFRAARRVLETEAAVVAVFPELPTADKEAGEMCHCPANNRPHWHDGTMPGNPVCNVF
jgi:hypothetical protein